MHLAPCVCACVCVCVCVLRFVTSRDPTTDQSSDRICILTVGQLFLRIVQGNRQPPRCTRNLPRTERRILRIELRVKEERNVEGTCSLVKFIPKMIQLIHRVGQQVAFFLPM